MATGNEDAPYVACTGEDALRRQDRQALQGRVRNPPLRRLRGRKAGRYFQHSTRTVNFRAAAATSSGVRAVSDGAVA